MYEEQFDNIYIGGKQTHGSGLSGAHALREAKMLAYLDMQRKSAKDLYKRSLLHPESYPNAKIPSEIPQETATAPVAWNGQIIPNSAGRFIFVIDPAIQTATLYNDESINGTGTAGAGTTINLDHDSTIIDMFRLVSMSVILTYSGSLDKMSGYIVGASTSNVSAANNNTFFTFTNIENIQNKRVASPIDGLKLIYSPYDNQQLEYQALSLYSGATSLQRWKKVFVIYGEGLPASTCLRWDIVRNIEYVSKPTLREYIPHVAAPACNFDASILDEVKKNEVTTLSGRMKNIGEKQVDQYINKGLSPAWNMFANEDKLIGAGQQMIGDYISKAFGDVTTSLLNKKF